MEQHPSVDDDRPYLRPERSSFPWIEALIAVALVAGTIFAFWYFQPGRNVQTAPVQKSEPAPVPQAQAQPPARNLLPAPDASTLPTLENSDSMMRESLAQLLGRKAFDEYVAPDRLVTRIVATVDNLPRRTAPRRMMPLHPVAGRFAAAGPSDQLTLDAVNANRYAPYVRAMEAVPARALVWTYVQTYPLFQRAYEELGYGGKYFNDRLVEAIDDMLEAPEVKGPVALLQPKVLYEYADPGLETRSAGQKILIRMGPENARKVKAKLREIRQALAQPPTEAPR